MPELRHLAFAAVAALLGGIAGWFGTPLVYVPWLILRHHLSLLVAALRRVTA